ncbi:coatomer epsilon subunit-domain-containing protein [Hyaloraphidium curvatum]|nr:coatomer epsilon subunit-domain-containing protein [Hyaloraphidium curvatum]
MADDENLQVRNLFYIGNYQMCVNACLSNPPARTDKGKIERQVFLHRAQLALGRTKLVVSEVESSEQPELQAVFAFALYLAAKTDADLEEATERVKLMAQENAGNATVAVLVATVLFREGLIDEALKALSLHPRNMECVSFMIQILLKMDRPDLARQQLAQLRSWAEDATIAQLAEAWVNLYMGGDQKYQEAFYIFEELGHGSSAKVLTGQAVCRLHQGKLDEAEQLLLESSNKDPNDPETLANLIVASHLAGKPADVVARYTNSLREVAPQHALLTETAARESAFDRAASRYTLAM